MQPIEIKMLGAFEVRRGGEPVPGEAWGRQKNRLLLKYFLAHRGVPIRQERLIEALYGEESDSDVVRNLLGRISEVRRILEPDLPKGNQSSFIVRVSQGTYLFPDEAPCRIDVDQFEAAVRRGDDLAASESWQLAARAYEEAVSAYTGDFLAEDPYEEWTLLPRERLREMYRGALIGAGQCRPKVGAYQDAVAWFDRAVALDPTDEVAHRGKMRALYLAGDRSRALLAYEECRKALENEGLEPDSETVELYNAIIDGTVETEAPVVRHNLPKPATPFFGRQFEIAEILREIGDPQNRVITLLGPGGIGKTRLALEAAFRCLSAFRDGVFIVGVPPNASTHQLLSAIAQAVDVPLQERQDPKGQLIRALRNKSILLIIDDGEHATGAAGLLEEIVQSTTVRLLAASRERMHVSGELIIEVEGLDYWDGSGPAGKVSVDALSEFSSTRLFVDRMRRVNHRFALSQAVAPDVAHICRLAGGMPLAIELAASWGRALSCAEIVAGIEQSLGFLASDRGDIRLEHRSIRAIFEHTWSWLTDEERRSFARLSVFRGGMSASAALKVAGAPLSVIVSLRDKGLLLRAGAERYGIHELLRQFAAEKLEESGDEEAACSAHASHFMEFLASSAESLNGKEQLQAIARLREDGENIESAFRRLVARDRFEEIAPALAAYARFMGLQTRWLEWSELLREAVERLRAAMGDADRAPARGRHILGTLLAHLGDAQVSMCMPAEAKKTLEEALEIAKGTPDPLLEATCLLSLGGAYRLMGAIDESERVIRRSVEIFRQEGADHLVAQAYTRLGTTLRMQGRYPEAERTYRDCLEIYRRIGDPTETAGALANLGTVYGPTGRLDEAWQCFEESLKIAEQLGNRYIVRVCTSNMGFLAYIREEYEQAKSLYLRAWDVAKDLANLEGMMFLRYYLALVCTRTGDLDQAEEYVRAGLEQALEVQATSFALRFVYALGRLLDALGRRCEAVAMFHFAVGHEATPKPTRNDVQADAGKVEPLLTESEAAAAKELAGELTLEAVSAWVKSGLREPLAPAGRR